MKIKKISIHDLIPDPENPRKDLKPEDPEYQKIENSLGKFGFVAPIIFDTETMEVIGGHQRLTVLKNRGVDTLLTIPLGGISWAFLTDDISPLDKPSRKALNVALNKIVGSWDMERLSRTMEDLKDQDYDLSSTGFDDVEIEGFLAGDLNLDPFLSNEPKKEKVPKEVECPNCGEKFTI